MALGIDDLTPAQELTVDSKFECAVATPDQHGRRGRKVSAKQLEVFICRPGGDVDLLIDKKVKTETDRAKEVEGSLQNLQTKTKANIIAAVNEVNGIAVDAKTTADEGAKELPNKADKIITQLFKTLSQADVGDVLGLVTFDTETAPPPPQAAGNIIFEDGSRFDLSDGGNMSYTDAQGGVTAIITDGVWLIPEIDTGSAAIQSENNANSGAWLFGKWVSGANVINLSDVNLKADEAKLTANAAAAAVVEEAARAQGAEGTLAAAVADCISSVGMTWV
jgi:ribosomal protein L17